MAISAGNENDDITRACSGSPILQAPADARCSGADATKKIILAIVIICALSSLGVFASWWLAFSIGLTILGTLGYLERAFNIKWSNRWSFSLLILFVLFSAAYIITSSIKSKHSERQITDLSKLYRPIEETALKHFPELPKEEAIKNYLNSISRIEADNKQLKEKNSKNEQRISEFMMTSKISEEMASQANKRAAEATRIAEGERSARKKIEERLADRSLTDAQLTAIADKVKPFSGQEFLITTYWDLKEPLSIANRIYAALNRAGWKYIKHERGSVLLGGMAGVLVYAHPAAEERTKKAAVSLVSALTTEGIASELREQNDPNNPNNRLYLNVGTKP